MTILVDITEAQKRFLEIIHAAEQGEAVIITKNAHPVVHIVAAPPFKHRPTFGSARGLMTIAEDFDAPLDDFRAYQP
ncbi:type II toxin-antitoxin system prevent-host-death family antitoxin [Candidatus Chloroploca sp. M-50]|uniref:Type II toxin-antitoxin system prevent-host-death family antitoxin n=1 Tax=Candidatus Chloroploca mongolica TaxID=2528176 RepID=A0ABS4DDF9_9CHLR|nr:type II toxin-antitoxin system prevent-host-death family antitoxin [Candidatus Chloroploca mongolica]MBP1467458.1 type II toxin-antitoxin system prevent-host-death family antitoxin [Candidatus Chloroploca mongolica]